MNERYVFEGARVIDPAAGVDEVRDVVVADGVIAGPEDADGAERIDARGLVLAPGLVDLHAHLREPGEEHKETIATGDPCGSGRWVHGGGRDGQHGAGDRSRRDRA